MPSTNDHDGDGCTDADELWAGKPGGSTTCGDDPWNPYDVTSPSTDVSGSYDIIAVAVRQNCNPALTGNPALCEMPGDLVPGFYYYCKADIQQSGKNLTARLLCYIDSPLVVVNPKAVPAPNSGATTCPPALPRFCGDGVSGAPPPGISVGAKTTAGNVVLFAKVGAKHTVLNGVVDNAKKVITLNGCFQSNVDNPPASKAPGTKTSFLGNVYARAVINLHTGHGQVNLWTGLSNGLTHANCLAGITAGAGSAVPVHIVRQAPGQRAKAPAQALMSITCDGTPEAGTRHVTTAMPHQMLYGGTVEITGAVPAAFNGRRPVIVDSPTRFHSVPKGDKPKSCGTLTSATTPGSYVPVRDSDGDNCPDKKELGDNPAFGGLRDPYNHYDYFNPTQDKLNRVDDILKVVNQYFLDDPVGMPDNKSNTDRTAVPGANPWNLSKPNGQQRVDDILAAVKQYFHDC